MNNEEKRNAVLKWEKTISEADAAFNDFLLFSGSKGKAQSAIFNLKYEYTEAVSKRIGDKDYWLDWYALENGMGKNGCLVTGVKGVDIVSDIEDLLTILLGEHNEV